MSCGRGAPLYKHGALATGARSVARAAAPPPPQWGLRGLGASERAPGGGRRGAGRARASNRVGGASVLADSARSSCSVGSASSSGSEMNFSFERVPGAGCGRPHRRASGAAHVCVAPAGAARATGAAAAGVRGWLARRASPRSADARVTRATNGTNAAAAQRGRSAARAAGPGRPGHACPGAMVRFTVGWLTRCVRSSGREGMLPCCGGRLVCSGPGDTWRPRRGRRSGLELRIGWYPSLPLLCRCSIARTGRNGMFIQVVRMAGCATSAPSPWAVGQSPAQALI